MHQTRKTHNAHNETQRRLKKVASQMHTFNYPKYNIIYYKDNNEIDYINPCWDRRGYIKVHKKNNDYYKSFEDTKFVKEHSFYVKYSKSNSSYWRWAKKRLHKIWRRKPIDKLTYTYKDAIGCSLYDLG